MHRINQIYNKYQNIFHNLSYMTFLRVFMMILPLLSYPYIIRVVGSENYGLVVYMLSIMAFFRILVKFGFEMSAVKNVAENSDDKAKLSQIISNILSVQIILYTLGFFILYSLTLFFDQFEKSKAILMYAYLLPLADILLVVWFFQGIEKMKYITIINVVAGLLGLTFIFIFIQNESDYIYVPLLQGISLLIGSVVSLWLVFKVEKIDLVLPNYKSMIYYFKDSWLFFISRISGVFNSETNTILLANFVSLQAVAYYDLAKKIVEVFKMPNSIINGVIYPYIAKRKDKVMAKKVFYIRILIAIFLIAIVSLFGNYFILFLGGEKMLPTLDILQIFSVMILFTAITYYTGATLLVSFGYGKKFNMSVIYSTVLFLLISFLLYITNSISLWSVLYAMIFVEIYIVIYRFYYCKRYKIL